MLLHKKKTFRSSEIILHMKKYLYMETHTFNDKNGSNDIFKDTAVS